LIRHGKTIANELKQYCGITDLPLSETGREELERLRKCHSYELTDGYIISGLLRTKETLEILYGMEEYVVIPELREMDFGAFERKTYEELKENPSYQRWISNIENECCENGEGQKEFKARLITGLEKVREIAYERNYESVTIVTHGGAIAQIMESFFPGEKNFYEWQPECGLGYIISEEKNLKYEAL